MVIRDCYGEPGAVLGSGTSGTPVSGDIAVGREGGGAALSPADAAGAVLSRWQAVFRPGSGNGNNDGAAGAYAGGVVTGGAAGVVAIPAAGLFVGEAGTAAVGQGALSGCAGAPAQMVRLAPHLKVGTREGVRRLTIARPRVTICLWLPPAAGLASAIAAPFAFTLTAARQASTRRAKPADPPVNPHLGRTSAGCRLESFLIFLPRSGIVPAHPRPCPPPQNRPRSPKPRRTKRWQPLPPRMLM